MITSVAYYEKALNWPVETWSRHCCDISAMIVRDRLVEGRLMIGYYVGPIDKESIFCLAGIINKCHHGWAELPGGNILDLTRWTFTNEEPFIYYGPNNNEYVDGYEEQPFVILDTEGYT